MIFIWHHALWLLLALPVLAGAYLLLRRRHKREAALRFAAFRPRADETRATVRMLAHVPALLLLAAAGLSLIRIER